MASLLIAASVLSADFGELRKEIVAVDQAGVDAIHWDVMDGQFVPNLTFGAALIKALRPYTSLCFDAHLMVNHPDYLLADLKEAGVDWVTIHAEDNVHLHRTLMQIQAMGMKAGIALNPATGLEPLKYVLPLLNHVLIMTVNPGFGGQSFLPSLLDKISEVQALLRGSSIYLQVDGGITTETAPLVVKRGANVLVAGTAIFKSGCYSQAVKSLRECAP